MSEIIREQYSPEAVANFFIEQAKKDGVTDLTQMKLHKLVYYAYGWALSLLNTDILGGKEVQAWQHGPIIPSLYYTLKHYKNSPITDVITGYFSVLDDDGEPMGDPEPETIDESDLRTRAVLAAVWDVYKENTAIQLRNSTHEDNTPWKMVYKKGVRDIVIPRHIVKAFFDVLRDKTRLA